MSSRGAGTRREGSSPIQGLPSYGGYTPWALRISPREAGLNWGLGAGNWHPPLLSELRRDTSGTWDFRFSIFGIRRPASGIYHDSLIR